VLHPVLLAIVSLQVLGCVPLGSDVAVGCASGFTTIRINAYPRTSPPPARGGLHRTRLAIPPSSRETLENEPDLKLARDM
jgi:hypothetical protein